MRGFQRPRGNAAAVAGGALVLVLLVVDLLAGASAALIPLLLVGPAVAAVAAPPRPTLWVAALALVCGFAIAIGEGFDGDHLLALLALLVGCAFVVLAALGRRRFEEALRAERAARVRSDFAARTGRLLEAPPDPDAMLAQVVRLAVPDMADMCVVDLWQDGDVTASVVYATDRERADAVRVQRERFPPDPGSDHPAPTVARTGEPALVAELPPERLKAYARSDEHYELMLKMRHQSAMFVPLVARGRTLGVMTLSRFAGGRTYTQDDLQLAGEVARRAALALDNARLFSDLQRAEAQLEAVLENLAEAVTVQGLDGELVYLNPAAARTLWLDDVETGLSTPIDELRGSFLTLDEFGRPVSLEALPGRRALLGEDPEPMLMRAVRRATGEQRWLLVKATGIRDEHGDVALAVNVIEDVTEQRFAERQQTFLAEASKLLSASLDSDVTFEQIASAAVPELADWCCVDVPDDRGGVRRAAIVGAADEQPALNRLRATLVLDPDDPSSIAHVMRTGHPVLARDLDPETRRAWTGDSPETIAALEATGTRSALIVPMTAGDRIVGMITLGTTHSERRLEGPELALALELGARAGIAVENARVHATRSHIATTLQRSLLPPRLPVIPGLTIAARFRAAGDTTEVGGDFYDLFAAGEGWMVVIGDVTGKGPEAAATTSLARFTMRTAAMYERSPAAVLARLNATLAVDPDRRQLCTAVCARVDPGAARTVRVEIACGGHPPPLLVGDGEVREAGRAGSLLGAFETGMWPEETIVLGETQSLVLFTDGVTDTRGANAERFGSARLAATLMAASRLDADEIAGSVDEALEAFEQGQQRDDVALLVLRAGDGESSLVAASGNVRSVRDSRDAAA